MRFTISECRKALVAAVAFAGELVSVGVLDGTAAKVVTAAIGALTVVGVYAVRNSPPSYRDAVPPFNDRPST
jgi:hypothetical protein